MQNALPGLLFGFGVQGPAAAHVTATLPVPPDALTVAVTPLSLNCAAMAVAASAFPDRVTG